MLCILVSGLFPTTPPPALLNYENKVKGKEKKDLQQASIFFTRDTWEKPSLQKHLWSAFIFLIKGAPPYIPRAPHLLLFLFLVPAPPDPSLKPQVPSPGHPSDASPAPPFYCISIAPNSEPLGLLRSWDFPGRGELLSTKGVSPGGPPTLNTCSHIQEKCKNFEGRGLTAPSPPQHPGEHAAPTPGRLLASLLAC